MLPGQLEEQIAEAAIFSKRELDAEKTAKRCQEALGYMSAADMVTTVGTGALFNFPVNTHLLRTALWKRAEVLKGKSKMRPSTIARAENTPVPDPAKKAISCSLSADIVFDHNYAYLVGMTQPVHFLMKQDLGYAHEGWTQERDQSECLSEQPTSAGQIEGLQPSRNRLRQ